jgi:3-methyladenine DNA glycosylase AlkD
MKRYFKQNPDDVFIGVRMGDVFKLAKEFSEMELDEVEKLMESEIHEARVGAVSILDYIARKKKTPEEKRKEIYDLYLKRHDRIDNWDLVDRAAIYVIGGYLADKDRSILYKLAKSKNMWERRTSIIATAYFMMKLKEVEDTCKIAEILIEDKEDLIHKATGWMLRVAGDVDQKELFKFLDKHAATMPRTALRYALEKVDKKNKEYYMGLAKKQNA